MIGFLLLATTQAHAWSSWILNEADPELVNDPLIHEILCDRADFIAVVKADSTHDTTESGAHYRQVDFIVEHQFVTGAPATGHSIKYPEEWSGPTTYVGNDVWRAFRSPAVGDYYFMVADYGGDYTMNEPVVWLSHRELNAAPPYDLSFADLQVAFNEYCASTTHLDTDNLLEKTRDWYETGANGSETDCLNGMDDNGNGLVDCDDPDCSASCTEDCASTLDNDGDGLGGCADSDCFSDPACHELNCADGIDGDNDTMTDCADPDCEGVPGCIVPEATEATCGDWVDNDNDGLLNCEDGGCAWTSHCQEDTWEKCNDGIDNDLSGLADAADISCNGVLTESVGINCSDFIDNDGDGLIDCFDPACSADPWCREDGAATCFDGMDNDVDEDMDCADSQCSGLAVCNEADCFDGEDNNYVNGTDCQDPTCWGITEAGTSNICTQVEADPNDQATGDRCFDGFDNDGDGFTDSADPECASWYVEDNWFACVDGRDNDGDGDTDCDDSQYTFRPFCTFEQWQGSAYDVLGYCLDGYDNDGDGKTVECAALPGAVAQ